MSQLLVHAAHAAVVIMSVAATATATSPPATDAPTKAPTAPPTMNMLVGSLYEAGCGTPASGTSMYAPDNACVPFEDDKFFGIDCAAQQFHLFKQPNCTDTTTAVASFPFTCAPLESEHGVSSVAAYGFQCKTFPTASILQWTFRKGGCDDDEAEESTVYYVELDKCQRPPNWELGDHDLGTRSFSFSAHGTYPSVNITARFWPADGNCTGAPDRVVDLPLDVMGGTRESCHEDAEGSDSHFERRRRRLGRASTTTTTLSAFMGLRTLAGTASSSSFKLVGNPALARGVKTPKPTRRVPTRKPTTKRPTRKPTAKPTRKPTTPTRSPTVRATVG